MSEMALSKETLHQFPKADLHRHLEGSLRLQTLSELAQRDHNINTLRSLVQITGDHTPDFHSFLERFKFLHRFYCSKEAIKRIAYEAVADAAVDNVKYLELRFSPNSLAINQGFSIDEVMDWVIEAVNRAQQDYEIKARLIVTIVREFDHETSLHIAEAAIAHANQGIVGLDLAGDEVSDPMEPFADVFQMAKEAGLGITVHAGEAKQGQGAESVRKAIDLLGAQRIGHGVRAGEDPALLNLLRERGITLEMCPTSNLQTGAVTELVRHPLRDLHRQGVLVTVNTDNPSISDITLTDEYWEAFTGIGITLVELKETILNGVRAAFLPFDEKEQLEAWFRKALARSAP